MRQVVQNLGTGLTKVAEVPCPSVRAGCVLVRTRSSLVSAGTERMLVEFSGAGLIGKARRQPEKVRQVLDKIKADGLRPTLDTVFARLDGPMPLGYCNAGIVLEAKGSVRVDDRLLPHAIEGSERVLCLC